MTFLQQYFFMNLFQSMISSIAIFSRLILLRWWFKGIDSRDHAFSRSWWKLERHVLWVLKYSWFHMDIHISYFSSPLLCLRKFVVFFSHYMYVYYPIILFSYFSRKNNKIRLNALFISYEIGIQKYTSSNSNKLD